MIKAEVEVTAPVEVLGHSPGMTFTDKFEEGFLDRKVTAGALKIVRTFEDPAEVETGEGLPPLGGGTDSEEATPGESTDAEAESSSGKKGGK